MSGAISAELAAHPFAAGLDAGQLTALTAACRLIELPAGRRIFDEGGPAASMWLLTAGRVALDLHVSGSTPVLIETLGPGDELGLSWLTPAARWQFGAIAQLPTTAIQFASADVMALCERDHELGYLLTSRLLRTAIARLQAARIRIIDVYAAPGGRQ